LDGRAKPGQDGRGSEARRKRRALQDAVPLWRQAQQRLADLNGEEWMAGLRSSLSETKVEGISGDSEG
jgi:hypothetical protein